VPFNVGGFSHTVSVGRTGELIVSTRPQPVESLLQYLMLRLPQARAARSLTEADFQRASGLAAAIREQLGRIQRRRPREDLPAVVRMAVVSLRELIQIAGNIPMRRGNLAVAYFNINGVSMTLAGISGEFDRGPDEGTVIRRPRQRPVVTGPALQGENRFFETFDIPDPVSGASHLRHLDAEVKLLEYIAERFAAGPGASGNGAARARQRPVLDAVGEVHLTSDITICPSCALAVGQFRRMFPRVRLMADSVVTALN
jgi:hypothetical protein